MEKYIVRVYLHHEATWRFCLDYIHLLVDRLHSQIDKEEEERQERKQA